MNVKRGAKVPKNVAFANVVYLIELKKRAKWIPRNIPAMRVLFRFLFFKGACFLKKLIPHKMRAPKLIRQKEIVTAGTLSK